MANKGLYLQRGLKKEKKSHRKIILLLAVLFALGVLVAPLLWKSSKPKYALEKQAIPKSGVTSEGGARQDVVVGKIPKTQPVEISQPPQDKPLKTGSVTQSESPASATSPETASNVGVSPSPSQSAPVSQLVGKGENIYELRSELKQKEIDEDKKAKEVVAKTAINEMPIPSGVAGGSGSSPTDRGSTSGSPAGKHTIVSMLEPEKKQKKQEPKATVPEKSSQKPTTTSTTRTSTPKSQQETPIPPGTPRTTETRSSQASSDRESASYLIQVGVYREETNAKKVKSIIDALGYETIIKQSTHPRLGTIYVVRVPVKGSKAEAQKLISLIGQKTGDKPVLMESR